MQLYNTLTRKKEEFVPIEEGRVRIYSCGPTVYDYAHIGNLRAFVFADILQKTLEYAGYKVKRVMNITDIGHLSSDADSGEDKMTKGLLREKKKLTLKNMRELAEFYTKKFKKDLEKLNVKIPKEIYFASDYVKEDTELVQKLEKKEYTYKTSDGIYFNTSKMPDYGILWGGKREWKKEGARIVENSEKKNPEDFALWKFNSQIGFESPWGKGFPGWHIECSAMGIKFLGEQFDIHTGGIDLIPTHHTNEIAQSESATGKKPFVKVWCHGEFLLIDGGRMGKSFGNAYTLDNVAKKGFDPLDLRFYYFSAYYRQKLNFTWEALTSSAVNLKHIRSSSIRLLEMHDGATPEEIIGRPKEILDTFKESIFDDLNMPRAIAALNTIVDPKEFLAKDKKI